MTQEHAQEAGMTKTTAAKEAHARGSKDAYLRERLATPTDLKSEATRDISAALAGLLADVFALYLKTKNFHWHMSGPNFRDYHLLLDEQSGQIFAMTDPIAERARKIGGATLRSIGEISRRQRILDNDADYVDPKDMLAELRDDNKSLTTSLREVHNVCDDHGDVATASLLEVWIDETERRTWFLFESTRNVATGAND
jgi:starvation-inducible DNA-binding protein